MRFLPWSEFTYCKFTVLEGLWWQRDCYAFAEFLSFRFLMENARPLLPQKRLSIWQRYPPLSVTSKILRSLLFVTLQNRLTFFPSLPSPLTSGWLEVLSTERKGQVWYVRYICSLKQRPPVSKCFIQLIHKLIGNILKNIGEELRMGYKLYVIHYLNSVSLTVQYFPEHYSQNLNLTLLIESFLSLLFYWYRK